MKNKTLEVQEEALMMFPQSETANSESYFCTKEGIYLFFEALRKEIKEWANSKKGGVTGIFWIVSWVNTCAWTLVNARENMSDKDFAVLARAFNEALHLHMPSLAETMDNIDIKGGLSPIKGPVKSYVPKKKAPLKDPLKLKKKKLKSKASISKKQQNGIQIRAF